MDLVDVLRRDAEHHIKKGTMKLPVDVDDFANRLVKANAKVSKGVFGRALVKLGIVVDWEKDDYVDAILQVCVQLDLEIMNVPDMEP